MTYFTNLLILLLLSKREKGTDWFWYYHLNMHTFKIKSIISIFILQRLFGHISLAFQDGGDDYSYLMPPPVLMTVWEIGEHQKHQDSSQWEQSSLTGGWCLSQPDPSASEQCRSVGTNVSVPKPPRYSWHLCGLKERRENFTVGYKNNQIIEASPARSFKLANSIPPWECGMNVSRA